MPRLADRIGSKVREIDNIVKDQPNKNEKITHIGTQEIRTQMAHLECEN
jgi:hypothetical protein